jgi:CubicO group peptidase (beta-lactamase class C family)
MGAVNGHSNARGVLDVMRVVSLGGSAGRVRLLSGRTVDRIFEVQADGIDLVLDLPMRFGIGFGVSGAGRTCFWGGWGGSIVFMDVDRRFTFSYVMNRMASGVLASDRGETYLLAAYAAL